MANTRKLRERLGMAPPADEPDLAVPPADKVEALKDAAAKGMEAVNALYLDRNKSVELAQSLHRHNVYLLNVNNQLREALQHANLKADHCLQSNARLDAWVKQAYDLLGRICGEVHRSVTTLEHMPAAPHISNNPDVPPLDTIGIPIPDEEYEAPSNLPPPIDHSDIVQMAERLRAER